MLKPKIFSLLEMLGVLVLLISGGCTRQSETLAHQPPSQVSESTWDAGIVFPGEATVMTFPLDDERVHSAADIVKITTSCECTSAIARNFIDGNGNSRVGVQLQIQEPVSSAGGSRGVNLLIKLWIEMHAGGEIARDVRVAIAEQ